ncbi:MAG TPA: hypothetical protein PLF13_02160 [candidate division Zixibacteria bacterium]|nr:hypothetical protein [candidate division Zixibacteria bacterium]
MIFDKLAEAKLDQLVNQAGAKAGELTGILDPIKAMIVEHFGQNGLYAAYIVLAALLLFIIMTVARVTFSALKYLVIPAIALAFVGSLMTSYSFVALLPVTVTISSVFLLVKG